MSNNKRQLLEKIFRPCFTPVKESCNGYFVEDGQECVFSCEHKQNCLVKDNDPIYTGSPGGEKINDNDIMVIAEAPSKSENKQCAQISQPFEYTKKNEKSRLDTVLDYFKSNHENTVPYFTDLIKCGFFKQREKNKEEKIVRKEIESKRRINCFKEYLIKEIEIIQPTKIYAVGTEVYGFLKDEVNQERISDILRKTCKVRYFMHYSREARNISIDNCTKSTIIWKKQDGIDFDINEMYNHINKLLEKNILNKYPPFDLKIK